MKNTPARMVLMGLAVGLVTAHASAAPTATSRWRDVRGAFLAPAPCAFTQIHPHAKTFVCSSVEIWDGAWNGVNRYTASGTFDLITGDVRGTVHELFTGVERPEDIRGTLRFLATFSIDGATSAQHVDARIVGSSGGFAGSQGEVFFDGVQISGAAGEGGYTGSWCLCG